MLEFLPEKLKSDAPYATMQLKVSITLNAKDARYFKEFRLEDSSKQDIGKLTKNRPGPAGSSNRTVYGVTAAISPYSTYFVRPVPDLRRGQT